MNLRITATIKKSDIFKQISSELISLGFTIVAQDERSCDYVAVLTLSELDF